MVSNSNFLSNPFSRRLNILLKGNKWCKTKLYELQPNDESYYNSFGIKTKFRFEKINEQKCGKSLLDGQVWHFFTTRSATACFTDNVVVMRKSVCKWLPLVKNHWPMIHNGQFRLVVHINCQDQKIFQLLPQVLYFHLLVYIVTKNFAQLRSRHTQKG